MLVTLVSEPFDAPGWLYEIKWDGYRALALCHKGKVELQSRNQKSFNEKFYPVYQAVVDWQLNAIIDGEICVVNERGLRILVPSKTGAVKRMENWCIMYLICYGWMAATLRGYRWLNAGHC
ncbi:hypothetical protein [Paraflavitalea speifideaquila]|uniref:ATP-dependent DNA ligase n=1 Tax=Paraflavitalea speifideaquila TaxID=3076558 RepID=UPI0028E8C6E7|nr:hypothetical protein [Paraflavitalea speifideiaquila]